MSKKQRSAWDIQTAALRSLRQDFAKAAEKSEQAVGKLVIDLADSQLDIRNNISHLGYPLHNLRFLQRGAEGLYEAANFSSHCPNQLKIWDDYLEEINRRHSGFGCVPENRKEISALIEQNGPKKMEMRLRQFMKRRIYKAQKNCKQGGYLF